MYLNTIITTLLAAITLVSARGPAHLRSQIRGPPRLNAVGPTGNSTFKQFIDHKNHSLGTFSQHYWYNDTFWSPGGPIILFTPGEAAALPYLGYGGPRSLTGQFAKAVGGATIIFEHRYWGDSSPYDTRTAETLQYLTLYNSIKDMTHFARTVNLPFDPKGTSKAGRAPWILSGGSYGGAQSAWTASVDPGTFWAYTASSAVVEAQYDFWQYFTPVQQGMAKNCSKDLSLIIDYVDSMLNGTSKQQAQIKDVFGLGVLEHAGDVGNALSYGPFLWQGNQFYENEGFFTMCDFVENANETNATVPGAGGVGLQKALAGYSSWFKDYILYGACGNDTDAYDASCFNTYDVKDTIYTDTSLDGDERPWEWMLCNEPFGWWQTGAPIGRPTLISRFVSTEYMQRQCSLFFPTTNGYTFGSNKGKTEADTNIFTGGWNAPNTTRIFFANGQYDPWREITYSSDFRPQGKLQSNSFQKVAVVPGGYHCSDLLIHNGQVNPGVARVQKTEIDQIVQWVNQFYIRYGRTTS